MKRAEKADNFKLSPKISFGPLKFFLSKKDFFRHTS
jgi:hypothetical protein